MSQIFNRQDLAAIVLLLKFRRRHRSKYLNRLHRFEQSPRSPHPGKYQVPNNHELAHVLNRAGLRNQDREPWTGYSVAYLLEQQQLTIHTKFKMPTLLGPIVKRRVSEKTIAALYCKRDRDGLIKEFLCELGYWIDEAIRSRGLGGRSSDLVPELEAVGALELWEALERAFGEKGISAKHLRNRIQVCVKTKLRESLDDMASMITIPPSTLKERRREAKSTGGANRPLCDRRPSDMPESVNDYIPWSGYHSFEFFEPVGEDWAAMKYSTNDLQNNRCLHRLEYLQFLEIVCQKALELAEGALKEGVQFMLKAPWMELKTKWRERKIATTARKIGWTTDRLKTEIEILALQIAYSFDASTLEFAQEYLEEEWPEILEIDRESVQNSDWMAISIFRETEIPPGVSLGQQSNDVDSEPPVSVQLPSKPSFMGAAQAISKLLCA